jgi:hypothetical protein
MLKRQAWVKSFRSIPEVQYMRLNVLNVALDDVGRRAGRVMEEDRGRGEEKDTMSLRTVEHCVRTIIRNLTTCYGIPYLRTATHEQNPFEHSPPTRF